MSDCLGRNIILATDECTVVSEYKQSSKAKDFKSEKEAKENLINKLQ